MYLNRMGLGARKAELSSIVWQSFQCYTLCARVIESDHTTIINWVKEAGESLPEDTQEDKVF